MKNDKDMEEKLDKAIEGYKKWKGIKKQVPYKMKLCKLGFDEERDEYYRDCYDCEKRVYESWGIHDCPYGRPFIFSVERD